MRGSPAGARRDRAADSRAAFELWNREGLEAFAQRWWAPDLVWEESPLFPDAGTHRGRDSCVRRMAERFEMLGAVEIDLAGVSEFGHALLQELVVRGRGASSGVPTEMREYIVVTDVREDGSVGLMREFNDREQAVAAARELGSVHADA